jgi:hypothetical protein
MDFTARLERSGNLRDHVTTETKKSCNYVVGRERSVPRTTTLIPPCQDTDDKLEGEEGEQLELISMLALEL